ncbi:hypothetical protein J6W78_11395 [bacterium]|nr:hypothetical protein [bacterium]
MKKRKTRMMNKISYLFLTILFTSLLFTACSLPDEEKKDVLKILEIREDLSNKGQTNKLAVIFTDSFPNRNEYLDQLKYRHFYFTEYDYSINSINFTSYNPLTKKASALIDFDLLFKTPEDPAPAMLLGRLEKVTLLKEKIGWKIDNIEEMKDSGRKIAPQLVHDIFYPLDTRKTALSNNDFQLFESVIHADFASRDELLSDFKENAEVFSEINYAIKERKLLSVSTDEKNAEVMQSFDLAFKTKEGGISEKLENQKEVISLKKSDDGNWKIIGGLR